MLRATLHRYRVYVGYLSALFATPFILSVLVLVSTASSYRANYFVIVGLIGLATALSSLVASLSLLSALVTDKMGESVSASLIRGSSLVPSFIPVAFIVLFVFLGGFSLLIIPGVVIAVFLSQTLFVFMEGNRGISALLSSWQLVRGHFFAVLGRLILLWIVTFLITSILTLVLSLLGISSGGVAHQSLFASILVTGVNFFILTPFSLLFLFELYSSLKTQAVTAPQLTAESVQKRRTLLIAFGVLGVCVSLVFVVFSRVFFNYAFLALELSPGPNRDFIQTLTEVRSLSPQSVQVHFTR